MNSLTCPQIINVASSSVAFTPFQSLWIPNSANLVVLGETPRRKGKISVYELNFGSGDESDEKANATDKNNSNILKLQYSVQKDFGFKCGIFCDPSGTADDKSSASASELVTGDFNGTLNIWDLEKLQKPIFEIKHAHSNIINCADTVSTEIVTGSRDGLVKLWDKRTDKHVLQMKPEANAHRDCWSVCFGNSYDSLNRMMVAGYDNGDCKILDLRTNKLFFECNVKNGICCVEFDRKNIKLNKLVITTLHSKFRVYDMNTPKHISEGFPYVDVNVNDTINMASSNTGKQGTTIWKCRHLPQNRDVWLTCLGNGSVDLYKYVYPNERCITDDQGRQKGVIGTVKLLSTNNNSLSTQPIVSWNWHKHKLGLACMTSLDQSIKVVAVTKLNKI